MLGRNSNELTALASNSYYASIFYHLVWRNSKEHGVFVLTCMESMEKSAHALEEKKENTSCAQLRCMGKSVIG